MRHGLAVRMGALGLLVAVVLLGRILGACSGGGGDDDGSSSVDTPSIEVVVAEETSPIVDLQDAQCAVEDDRSLTAHGVARSKGDAAHYVNIAVRFVDAEGVRVELVTDSVTDLLPAESARWDVSTSADAAGEVRRCEISATVS